MSLFSTASDRQRPVQLETFLARQARLWRTARHLRGSQIVARLYRSVRPAKLRKRALAPSDNALQLRCDFPDLPPAPGESQPLSQRIGELERGEFSHLNHTEHLRWDPTDWRLGPIAGDRLWTVTLHYHRWLYELGVAIKSGDHDLRQRAGECARHYLGDWLSRCDLAAEGAEHLAWNSYAVATRLMWWIRSHRLLENYLQDVDPHLLGTWRRSIWIHANYLARNLEWDLRANHLLRDLVGLASAGRFFEGAEPRHWLKTATRLATSQANEQVLTDGGHFERSPLYHAEVMGDLLQLSALLECPQSVERLRETWSKMSEFCLWMRHPDGTVPQFNDAASISPTEEVTECARWATVALDPSSRHGGRHFQETGVIVWHGQPWSLFFDVGQVGPDFQPGHAHADTLTLDCSFAGRRLFVDPGCLHYDNTPERAYDRSTAAHNTVCIDGSDSSEVWHIFRVGRRARPVEVQLEIRENSLAATASHDGYDHLAGRPRHSRSIFLQEHGALKVQDRVTGLTPHDVSGGFLLAPEWKATQTNRGWTLECAGTRLDVGIAGPDTLKWGIEQRALHSDYGRREETQRLSWSYSGPLPFDVELQVEACA